MNNLTHLDARSLALRRKVVEILRHSRRGHVGSTFSALEIMRVLYDRVLRIDPAQPEHMDRDRCILSKGHGCLAQYVMLAEKGFFPEHHLASFCKLDSILGGHPDRRKVPGVEACTGSLGHGLSIGVGFALSARYDRRPTRTYVVLGDGECNEGSIWEAALCAAKHRLSTLTAIVDYNKHQSYDATAVVLELEPFADKWRSFGFAVEEVDGHDVEALTSLFARLPLDPAKPTAVICHTVKGRGCDFAENNLEWHHKSGINDDTINGLLQGLERCICEKPA